MRRMVMAAAAVAALQGCAQAPNDTSAQPMTGGGVMLAVVGTPFLIIGKIPACALTLAVAGPVGATAMSVPPDDSLGRDVRQGLADGIDENCGPPYVVTP